MNLITFNPKKYPLQLVYLQQQDYLYICSFNTAVPFGIQLEPQTCLPAFTPEENQSLHRNCAILFSHKTSLMFPISNPLPPFAFEHQLQLLSIQVHFCAHCHALHQIRRAIPYDARQTELGPCQPKLVFTISDRKLYWKG